MVETAYPPLAELRTQLRAKRRAVTPQERLHAADAVARGVLALLEPLPSGYVAGYWAVDGEVPLHALQLRLPQPFVYCLPVVDTTTHTLRFAPFRAGDAVAPNRFGIPEPVYEAASLLHASELAAILLPLTGFDAQANRLGMGGGWYDRSLDANSPTPLRIGIGFECQRVAQLNPQSWDVPCHAVVSETRTYFKDPA